ncbi:hypothetical protein [Kitasatospora sp. GP82]|uniref:hypothetical protein n=1 Tax=Kitasatospora sp. GP82 TaxID=3035089 RepID=UPI00247336F1|nr:hypothetical protein [Kitasatospora sp. GP82]MDH6125939.1 hypothetical protein [Kitasatospora sp. GP82]
MPFTDPAPLSDHALGGETCPHPDCGRTATSGTLQWDDRGPFQLISRHTYTCPAGHRWIHDTDGG